ncbi:MAG: tetratricopeptide repeat protein [Bacteroidales bacterium]|jgi:tetratricopeptide (TPR) repeat protein|nr:tetratricopeptide repeat protein [Bacteroidales bacterium]
MGLRLIYIIILLLFPSILFSQNISTKALCVFIDIDNGKYITANDSLDDLISNNPKPEFYLAKAEIFFKLSNYNEALTYCNKLDKIKPFYSSELKLKIYLENEDQEKAKLVLEENLKSTYKISLFDLLETEEHSSIYQLELEEFILSGNLYSRTEKQLYQAERLILDNKYNQALFIVKEMLSRNNNIAQAHYLQSKIEYFEGDLNGSLKSINAALNLKKSNSEYLKQRRVVNYDLKEYKTALQDINKLIKINPYQIDYYITKADLLFKTDQFDEAINLTNYILEILPDNSDVLYLSSKSHFKNKNYFEALKAVNQSLQIKSKKEYYELRGDIYCATNTYEFAIKDYSMFLDMEAYNGDIYAKKGYARLKLGDKKGACSDWEKGKRYGSYEAINYLERYCR